MRPSHRWLLLTAPDDTGSRLQYLTRTLGQLAAQGLASFPDLDVFNDVRRHGQAWNLLRALRVGVASGAERLTVIEDDIEICRGFVARVEALEVPRKCEFIAWFDSFLGRPRPELQKHRFEPIPDEPGFVRRLGALFYCSQAVTFSRDAATAIVESAAAKHWNSKHEGDQLIASVFRHQTYAVHVPSLVQHVGHVSLCNPGESTDKENRFSHHYRGADFDAGTLGFM